MPKPVGDSQHVTLAANAVTVVTLDDDYDHLEVVNVNGGAAVYFTVDGSTPTVKGRGTVVLPAAVGGISEFGRVRSVRLISTGAPDVNVRAW